MILNILYNLANPCVSYNFYFYPYCVSMDVIVFVVSLMLSTLDLTKDIMFIIM